MKFDFYLVAARGRGGFQPVHTRRKRHPKPGHAAFSRAGAQGAAVEGQRYGGLVGVHLHGLGTKQRIGPGGQAAAQGPGAGADANERRFQQARLVEQIVVFGLTVEGEQALGVDVRSGFLPALRAEIGQVPDGRAGHEGPRLNGLPVVLVVAHGVLRRLVEADGLLGVHAHIGIGPVLRNDEWLVGQLAVVAVQKPVQALEFGRIPAVVQVPTQHLRDGGETGFAVEVEVAVHGQHGVAAGVFAVAERVELPGQLGHAAQVLLALGVAHVLPPNGEQDLVHVGPEDDAGVVEALPNHLGLHGFTVLKESLRLGNLVHHRNFLRRQNAQPVAGAQHGGVLRVVGNAQKITAHVLEQLHVALVQGIGQGIAEAGKILVPAGSDELQGLPIQEKAQRRIKPKPTEAQRIIRFIEQLLIAGFLHRRHHAVQIRVGWRPQVRPAQPPKRLLKGLGLARWQRKAGLLAGHGLTLFIKQLLGKQHPARPAGFVGQRTFHHHFRRFGRHLRRADEDAAAAVIVKVEMHRPGRDEVGIAVKTAVEGEVGRERGNVGVVAIVHLHQHHVTRRRVGLQQLVDGQAEGGVAADVRPGFLAVHIHVGHLVGSLKREVHAPPGGPGGHVQRLLVPARPPVVAGRVVEGILRVPGVGQAHGFPASG